ncbi:MAG: PAS domain S-box protein, partial [Rubrivivax sp.]|nr:PAS domain S-box protein [Rubrivivax sp.]
MRLIGPGLRRRNRQRPRQRRLWQMLTRSTGPASRVGLQAIRMDSNSQHKDQVPAPARGRRRRTTGGAHDHIIHAAREAIVTIDEQQRIVMVNPAAERLFASSAAQMLGSALEQFIPQRHRQGHAEQVRRFGAGRRAERPMAERRAVTGLRADGSEFPLEATISRADFDDPQGPRRLYTALLRDLS